MLKFCNLCSYPIIRINKTNFGTRCIRCKSTYAHRAIGFVLQKLALKNDIKIHEFSNHGAFLKYLKREFKNVSTSEYYDDVNSGDFKNGIQCQDLQKLKIENCSFDVLTSTEVFEHVPNDIQGFQEIYRVLNPKGHFIFTVPINVKSTNTIERAKIVNGEIIHILEPEYHGDHLRNKGILSFRTYGIDILDKLKEVGFSDAKIVNVFSEKYSIKPMMHVIHCTKSV